MKNLVITLALLLGGVASAQAQVYFDSGSTKPNNPDATRHVVRQATVRHYVKVRPNLYRCRDGSRRSASQCSRHGGIARR